MCRRRVRRPGAAERLHARGDGERAAVNQPSGHSFRWSRFRSTSRRARRSVARSRRSIAAARTSACRRASRPDSQGRRSAFQASLANEPLLILAALITVYIVLGVLYESYIHPITILSTLPSAGVGALLALMVSGTEFSVIALIGIVLLIGIVKKNAIMMIDFALDAERTRAQVTGGRDLSGRAAALPADHDDDDGGAASAGLPLALGYRDGLGAAPAARHRDRRRPAPQPAADAVHDAGHLPRVRSARGSWRSRARQGGVP